MQINNLIIATTSNGAFLRQLNRNLKNKSVVKYSFATAFFDFKILKEYFESLESSINNGAEVQFLISNKVSGEEFQKIKSASTRTAEEYLNLFPSDYLSIKEKMKLYEWIRTEKIKFKVVFKVAGIFHYKLGYMEYSDGTFFVWNGSANHTFNGLSGVNEEHIGFGSSDSRENDIIKMFDSAWIGNIDNCFVVDAQNVIESELAVSLAEENKIDYLWFENKWEKSLILLNNRVYYFSNEPIFRYDAPQANWDELSDCILVTEDLEFNKLKMQAWIRKNKEVYVSSNLVNYLADNVTKMKELVEQGLEIKNNWETVKCLEEFSEFSEIASKLKREPFDLQLKQSYFASKLHKTLNFSVPGTGKTMVSLVTYNYLKQTEGVNKLFVIGPTSSHEPWKEEFKDTFGREPKVINLSKMKMNYDDKYRFILTLKDEEYDICIMHFATASKYFRELLDIIDEKTFFVVDEAHYIKNPNGEWGRAISKLGEKSKYSLLLTGTPAPNGIQDIYNIISITYGKPFMFHFMHSSNQEELISALHMKITYDDLKMEYKQINKYIEYDLNDEQEDFLDNLNRQMMLANGQNGLELLIRRMQVTSSINLVEGETFTADESPKLEEMMKRIDIKKNIVIWANFKKSIDSIYEEIKRSDPNVKVYKYYGSYTSEERAAIIYEYKNYGGILIANPQTLAEAVSLHKNTDYTVYFEYNFNLIHWQQSRNRTFRYGMTKDMEYLIMRSSTDKLDQAMLDRLVEKSDFQSALINYQGDGMEEKVIDEIRLLIERMS